MARLSAMPPSPTPLPVPDPAPPVVVNIPPDLLGQVHNDTWFTQPIATVIAASIALVAAIIAWSGARAQIAAEDRRLSRSERLDALTEAYASAHHLVLAWSAVAQAEESTAEARQTYANAFVRALLARGRLAILKGFGPLAQTFEDLLAEATAAANRGDPGNRDGAELSRLLEKLNADLTTQKISSTVQLKIVRRLPAAQAPSRSRAKAGRPTRRC